MARFPQRSRINQPCVAAIILSAIADKALTWMRYVVMRKLPPQWARAFRRPVCRERESVMNGSKYRFNDHREFFRPASKVEPNGHRNGAGCSATRSQRCVEDNGQPPGERRRHCTAGEIAQQLGYSVSYILAVKKAMHPNEATRPVVWTRRRFRSGFTNTPLFGCGKCMSIIRRTWSGGSAFWKFDRVQPRIRDFIPIPAAFR
jgi:hypothetical protein